MAINKTKSEEKRLKILLEVAKAINSPLNINKILNYVVDAVKQLGYDLCSILLREEEFIAVKAAYGLPEKQVEKIRIKIGEGITGSVAKSKMPEMVNDVSKDKRYIKFGERLMTGSELAVPIIAGNELIGVFNLEDRRKNAFNNEDLKIVTALADQLAISIKNSKLLFSLRHTNENLSIIYETGNIINSTLVLDKILKNILNLVVKKLNYDNFSILLLEGDKLFLKAAYKHPKKYDKNYYIKVNEGVTGYVAKNGKPQIINDVTKDKRYIPVRRGIKSEMAVPLKIGDNVKGVLNVESKKLNAFDENDLFLLSTVADQAAIAIQNATINKFLAQSNQKLKIINEIGKVINSSLDLDKIFSRFLHFMSKQLNYDFCAILLIENNRLYSRAGIGFTPMEIEDYGADIGEGICGMVAKTGKPVITNDVSKVPFYKKQSLKTKSEISVPLKVEGKVIGVVNVESRELNAFDKEDLVYLSALADQVTVSIRNAQMYNKIKNFNIELKEKVDRATTELRSANKELERLNQVKSDFVSTVSHELRTPITSIQGYVSLIHDGDAGTINEEQKEFLGIVKSESQRLTRLISDLLDISKIEEGRMQLIFDDFDLLDFLNNYKKEIQNMALSKDIKIHISMPLKLPIIKADSDKIKQIFNNLIGNAIKFSDKNTTLEIVVKENSNNIQIEITDQGIGIAKKYLKKIFEKFQQVDNKMTRKVGGTGLGLAIIKHLIEAHGGHIRVKSKLGEGSTFSFTISKNLK
ncbi:GAF domain-containing protein [Candidatus Woesearchaeota archaeon]|nr:GAF domain-containing protein [Candidatus Woesearchaeota archaeon]